MPLKKEEEKEYTQTETPFQISKSPVQTLERTAFIFANREPLPII
jgi:hypothetical protein